MLSIPFIGFPVPEVLCWGHPQHVPVPLQLSIPFIGFLSIWIVVVQVVMDTFNSIYWIHYDVAVYRTHANLACLYLSIPFIGFAPKGCLLMAQELRLLSIPFIGFQTSSGCRWWSSTPATTFNSIYWIPIMVPRYQAAVSSITFNSIYWIHWVDPLDPACGDDDP